MKVRGIALLLAAALSLGALTAGCGSSSSSSSSTHHHRLAKAAAVGAGAVVVHHEIKKHRSLRPGQYCTPRKRRTYRRHHLACVGGRLQSA